MMKLVYAYYEQAVDALEKGATINNLVKMSVRERIGRYKYTIEADVDTEYAKISEELNIRELANLIGRRTSKCRKSIEPYKELRPTDAGAECRRCLL